MVMDQQVFREGMAYLRMSFDFPLKDAVMLFWFKMLKDLSDDAFLKAIKSIVLTHDRMPTIAEIRRVALEESDESPMAEEAWLRVIDDIHRLSFYNEPEYEDPRLEKTKRLIGWRELCDMTAENKSIIRAQFMRAYNAFSERERQKALCGINEGVNAELMQRLFGGMLPGEKKAG
jgi:hypothetical protein